MKQHKEYRKTPKTNFDETVKKYIEIHKLQDSLISHKLLYQVRGTLPIRIIIGETKNGGKLLFEEKEFNLKNRHYGYTNKISYNLLFSDGEKSVKIKDYNTFLNNYYYSGEISLYEKYNNLDVFARFFKEIKTKNKKIERKQFRFSLTDEEHEIVKEFIKRLKKTIQVKSEKIVIPDNVENNNYEEELIG